VLTGPTINTQFLLKEVFPTEEAALSAALIVGKQQVDKRTGPDDLHSVIEQQSQLPSTHRHGLGHRTDNVAMNVNGPTKVPGPSE
jgi:hypothetical protein